MLFAALLFEVGAGQHELVRSLMLPGFDADDAVAVGFAR